MNSPHIFFASLLSFLVSYMVSSLLTRHSVMQRFSVTRPDDINAVQSSHTIAALRLGGTAIVAGVIAGYGFAGITAVGAALIFSGMVSFFAGLWEDLTGRVSAARRLIASFISSAALMLLLGISSVRTDVPVLDALAHSFPVVSAVLLMFAASGFTHALNLVDGMNGFAASVSMMSALCLGLISFLDGRYDQGVFSICLVASIAGFFIFNWPHGRLFLGDGGAYLVGHLVFWAAALSIIESPHNSVSAVCLIMFWPMADLLTTMGRRLYSGKSLSSPDRLHFHQVIRRGIEIITVGRKGRRASNPITTLVLFPLVAAPSLAGMFLVNNSQAATTALSAFSILYLISYTLTRMYLSRMQSRRVLAASRSYQRLFGRKRQK